MQVAIASGKGGTGKTTVATNLAATAARDGCAVHLIDCDVEEPNCHLFVSPEFAGSYSVSVPVPVVDPERCNACGECAAICQFNALACLPDGVMVFPELCHSCGGCWLVCPEEAISQGERTIGVLEDGWAPGLRFTQGCLEVGEAQVPPMIRRVKAMGVGQADAMGARQVESRSTGQAESSSSRQGEFWGTRQVEASANGTSLTIIDAPPGTSCPAIAAMRGCDFVVLVTEPTPFGLHDLELAVATVRRLELPFGVVVNREGTGDDRITKFCQSEGIQLIGTIPDDRRIAKAYAAGILAISMVPEMVLIFRNLRRAIMSQMLKEVS
jgi:MinD superfamily P-loop ATPase